LHALAACSQYLMPSNYPRRHALLISHVLLCTAGHGYDVRDVAVSADNSKFASAGGDRQLFLWDVATGQTIRKFAGHDGVINSVS
jgi:WD40 repeat protein